eukprot:scaffold38812_cov18-Tisochrysis_lutea.AAC.1
MHTQCTALASCDLACLKAHDLVAAMRGFPETAAKVRLSARTLQPVSEWLDIRAGNLVRQRAMVRMNQLQAAGKIHAEMQRVHE